jgi:hypothetical protein
VKENKLEKGEKDFLKFATQFLEMKKSKRKNGEKNSRLKKYYEKCSQIT